ncbi:MAG: hypothetical protein KatS3mg095_0635 [Candidatus Parcubacteria bacterium]|nr:MAG: hypothetical protein KatS3mg095_0635 [Candidatus Parcubacteria bacterium]
MIIFALRETFLLIIIFLNVLLGFSVLLQAPKKEKHILFFFLLSLSIICWAISLLLYGFQQKESLAFLAAKTAYFFALLVSLFLLLFTINFCSFSNFIYKRYQLIINIFLLSIAIFWLFAIYSNYVISGHMAFDSVRNLKFGPLYFLYLIFISLSFIISLYLILKEYFIYKSQLKKYQILSVLIGILISIIGGIITNAILPSIGILNYYWLGPIFTLFTVIGFFIGITAFNLFNIKIISTQIFSFLVWLGILIYLISPHLNIIIKIFIFIGTIVISLLLIQSVYQEIEQREKLAELNQKLEYQYNLRGKILSIISHQIRSPLVNIREFVRFLINGTYGTISEKVNEILIRIEKNINEELNLVNDLADFRKIEEGQFEYNFNSFNLIEIIKDVFEIYQPLAKNKNLELKLNVQYDQLQIYGDKERLKQVLINLVDNAIKYTDQGWVEIEIIKKDKEILIIVKDSGRGINKENLETIFEEFICLDKKKNILGTGLGLYLSKKIIEAHNGKIWAESEGENKGSNFYIKIPLS